MDKSTLIDHIKAKQSYLCIGLDTDLDKIPKFLLEKEDPIFEFNKAIIDATADLCVAYKPNIAFYESYGSNGWAALEKTIAYIGKDHFIIADAKRGDIGNTSQRYAKAFFEQLNADAVTVAPYMGMDSVQPFFCNHGEWVILLALTSNQGSTDFQKLMLENGQFLFEEVIDKAMEWGTVENLMFVVGATHPDQLKKIRERAPEHFFLIPGVGAQGGDLTAVSKASLNEQCGILINSSRSILYASADKHFAEAARSKAQEMQKEMTELLQQNKII